MTRPLSDSTCFRTNHPGVSYDSKSRHRYSETPDGPFVVFTHSHVGWENLSGKTQKNSECIDEMVAIWSMVDKLILGFSEGLIGSDISSKLERGRFSSMECEVYDELLSLIFFAVECMTNGVTQTYSFPCHRLGLAMMI